jgi:hypothetical protein
MANVQRAFTEVFGDANNENPAYRPGKATRDSTLNLEVK